MGVEKKERVHLIAWLGKGIASAAENTLYFFCVAGSYYMDCLRAESWMAQIEVEILGFPPL